ncbi:hypothetical protein Pla52o_28070 [Novipirellula galeiformis]|uniref:Uncharacterized protein n=1 Tax=Novipirellula galeiformis TaxID=2528004 RepID=A0A5C6CIR7_9BACT|nr:hypothetical protein Pla52o_28070 [Novipirellula galeiformis]
MTETAAMNLLRSLLAAHVHEVSILVLVSHPWVKPGFSVWSGVLPTMDLHFCIAFFLSRHEHPVVDADHRRFALEQPIGSRGMRMSVMYLWPRALAGLRN